MNFLVKTIENLRNNLDYFGVNYMAREHYAIEAVKNNLVINLSKSDIEKLNAILLAPIKRGRNDYMTSRRLSYDGCDIDFEVLHILHYDSNSYYAICESLKEFMLLDELLHEPEVFIKYIEEHNMDYLYKSEIDELAYIRDKSKATYYGHDIPDHFRTEVEKVPATIYHSGNYHEGFWKVYHQVRKEEHNREELEDTATIFDYIKYNNNYKNSWYEDEFKIAMKKLEEDENNNLTFEFFKKPDFINVNGEQLFIKEYRRNERTILKSDKYSFVGFVGSRKYNNTEEIKNALSKLNPHKHIIVSGGANGADSIATFQAVNMGFKCVIIHPFLKGLNSQQKKINNKVMKKGFICSFNDGGYKENADYFKRNNLIALICDELKCFGLGKGSKYTVNKARNLNKEVTIFY